ncbi:MAG TPA: tetratricopeptide repeat protein, partial [Polyangiaceae bacterium]
LGARDAVVPFFEAVRASALASLDSWCDDDRPIAIRLYTGAAGSGKTRLLIEHCTRRRRGGWRAGFLLDEPTAVESVAQAASGARNEPSAVESVAQALAKGRTPALVVIDYAESRQNLSSALEQLIDAASATLRPDTWRESGAGTVQPARSKRPVLRVVLLARVPAEWWEWLRRHPRVGHVLDEETLQMSGVALEGSLRADVFAHAARRFAAVRKREPPRKARPSLDDAVFERPLYLQMAALAHVDGLELRAENLLEGILSHEQQFWLKFGQEPGPAATDDARARLCERGARLMAAVTLRGGVTREEVSALAAGIDGPGPELIDFFHRRLYPGAKTPGGGQAPGATAPRKLHLRGLDPDLLGEALVSQVIEHGETRSDYLHHVLAGAPNEAVRHGIIVLERIATAKPDAALDWIAAVLSEDTENRALMALDHALALSKKTAASLLGRALERAMRAHGSSELAELFHARLPWETVSFRELAAWTEATRAVVPQSTEQRAAALENLSARLSALGQREEALGAAEQAVDHYRALAAQRPDAFLPGLARSLNNLGAMLSELGRREEALDATGEAVDQYRKLAAERPNAFLPDLAMSLNNLGNSLSELGRREAALDATEEAVEQYRKLAAQRPDAFLPNLAMSLNNLGYRLSALGQPEAALDATGKAVAQYRKLATERPDAFLPNLAGSLNNLGAMLSALGRREAALVATEEAVGQYRKLAAERPDAFLPDLAMSLNNLGNRLSDLGRREAALDALREAVGHYELLASQYPDAFGETLETVRENLELARQRHLTAPVPNVRSSPPPRAPPAVDTRKLLERAGQLLDGGDARQALALLEQAPEKSVEFDNARAVCQLRLGNAQAAQQLLGVLVLHGPMRHLRDDVPAELQANYAVATLLFEGLEECEQVLARAAPCEASDRLRADIAAYRKGSSFWQGVKRFFSGASDVKVPLSFEPGVLIGGKVTSKARDGESAERRSERAARE